MWEARILYAYHFFSYQLVLVHFLLLVMMLPNTRICANLVLGIFGRCSPWMLFTGQHACHKVVAFCVDFDLLSEGLACLALDECLPAHNPKEVAVNLLPNCVTPTTPSYL